jgi:hypothetical protein
VSAATERRDRTAPCSTCGYERSVSREAAEDCRDCRYVAGITCELDPDDVLVEFRKEGNIWVGIVRCICGKELDDPDADCVDCMAWAERDAARQVWPRDWWENDAEVVELPTRRNTRLTVDPVAVERAVRGDLRGAPLNLHEREAAVRILHEKGEPDRTIAERVECTMRSVLRIRKRLGLPANFSGRNPIERAL